jgi:hypothetical protein
VSDRSTRTTITQRGRSGVTFRIRRDIWAITRPPDPVKKSICLPRLNFPHNLHHSSGRVSAQTPCLMLGCRDDARDGFLNLPARRLHRRCRHRPREPRAPPSTAGLQRSVTRPRLARWDRIFWVWLSRLWANWRSSLVIVKPATVLACIAAGSNCIGAGTPWPIRSAPGARPRDLPSDPAYGSRESNVGPATHQSVTRPARVRGG